MAATLRQIEANRRNARKSTGPRTDEGKKVSRGNALKHGLAGNGVVRPPAERAAFEQRLAAWKAEWKPSGPSENWFLERMVSASVRIDRCDRIDLALRQRFAFRAAVCWDEDHRKETERVGERLPRSPGRVVRELQTTRHGVEWLLERWRGLAEILDRRIDWNDEQRRLALDLLATPRELRDGPTRLDPPDGLDPIAHRLALALAEIEDLESWRDEIGQHVDAHDRELAEQGIGAEVSRPLMLAHRYESAANREFHRALNQFLRFRREARTTLFHRDPLDDIDLPDDDPDPDIDLDDADLEARLLEDSDSSQNSMPLDTTDPSARSEPEPAPIVVVEAPLLPVASTTLPFAMTAPTTSEPETPTTTHGPNPPARPATASATPSGTGLSSLGIARPSFVGALRAKLQPPSNRRNRRANRRRGHR